jgi:TetR/AcrR family tetracycline transcriptional repressor
VTPVGQRTSGPRRLSRDDVIQASVELIAKHGLPALTVRAVADALGVRSPSIYHHLPGGFQELRTAVVEKIASVLAEEFGPEGEDTIWQWVEKTPRRIDQASRRYPGVLPYLVTTGLNERVAQTESHQLAALVLKSELRDVAPEAMILIQTFITGWVCADRQSAVVAGEMGYDALALVLTAAGRVDSGRVLADGLQALVAGLALDVERHPKGADRV